MESGARSSQRIHGGVFAESLSPDVVSSSRYRAAVAIPNDEEFRALVDARGVLLTGALDAPSRTEAFTVFAQRSDAIVEANLWERHAAQFFSTKVGLTIEKKYGEVAPPTVDAARVIVAPPEAPPGTRLVYGRPREDDDFAAADAADARAGSTGLDLLAKRCGYVWLVVSEGDDDRLAMLLAAIVASVVLGPILSPDQEALFGVRTARAKLEAVRGGYR